MAQVYCRSCGKEVEDTTAFCPHCGASQHGERGSPVESTKTIAELPKPAVDYGMLLLGIPIVVLVLIALVVPQMSLLESPEDTAAFLSIIAILGTAIVAAMEATKIGMKSDRQKGTYKPPTWFMLLFFLWIVGYPLYLYKRKHFGLPNRLGAGALVAFIFLGGAGWIVADVEEQKIEVAKTLGLGTSGHNVATTSEAIDADVSAFSCMEHPDLPQSADFTIKLVQNVRPINATEKEVIAHYAQVKGIVEDAIGLGSNDAYVLSQKIPGKLLGLCVADAYYHGGENNQIMYAVSLVNDEETFVTIIDNKTLFTAAFTYEYVRSKQQEANITTQDQPQGITNAAKDSLPPGLPLNEGLKETQQVPTNESIQPSFNCGQATAKIDKTICENPELARLDAQVFESYKEAMKTTSADQTTQLVNAQKEWVKKRNQCESVQCIADAYEQRDRELAPWDYEVHEE